MQPDRSAERPVNSNDPTQCFDHFQLRAFAEFRFSTNKGSRLRQGPRVHQNLGFAQGNGDEVIVNWKTQFRTSRTHGGSHGNEASPELLSDGNVSNKLFDAAGNPCNE